MSQAAINFVITAIAVLFPILVTTMDRAYGRGELRGEIQQIQRDLAELRGMFVLTPKEPTTPPKG